MLQELVFVVLATALLATFLRAIDAWQKEVRLHRRLNRLQSLVLAIERSDGNSLRLQVLPAAAADSIKNQLPNADGVLAVLSCAEDMPHEAGAFLRRAARLRSTCLLVEGSTFEVAEFSRRNALEELSPMAVPTGIGNQLVEGMSVPYLVEIQAGVVIRRSTLLEPSESEGGNFGGGRAELGSTGLDVGSQGIATRR